MKKSVRIAPPSQSRVESPPPQKFSDDAPNTDPWSEDRLGYRPFSESVAKAILNLDAPNGYVIGLHGAWGSGKSTILNFVQAFIDKHNKELLTEANRLRVIDFRPWIVSGHQDLVSAFFKVLSETLDDKATKRTKRWKWAVRVVRVGADPLIDAAATVGLVVDPSAGVASKAASAMAKKSIASWLKEPSLQSSYEELRARLANKGGRFIVIIDDIDRLDRSEIRSIMQMVKTVGQLPNVVYLLAYDRKIVWAALDGDAPQAEGQPSFGEKIVQQELELPQPRRSALLRILDDDIRFLFDGSPNTIRWRHLVQSGIHQWIRYPRDASRLSNAVKFAWPALENEIDPHDLLSMEGLRLFDQPVFDWIRHNRDLLLNQGRLRIFSDEQKAAVTEALRNSLAPETREDQLEVLCALFPAQSMTICGKQAQGFGGEQNSETVARRGIACEAGYDAYFNLYPSPNAVPKTVIDTAIRQLDNEAVQIGFLREYFNKQDENGASLIADYRKELRCRFLVKGAAQPTTALLNALFEIGEDILGIEWDGDFLSQSPRTHLSILIKDMLVAWPERAGAALLAAFGKCKSPAFCADVWLARGRELGVIPSGNIPRANLISSDTFEALGTRLLEMINAGAASGSLDQAPFYYTIAPAWSHLAGDDAVHAWISKGVSASAIFLARLASGLMTISYGQDGRIYTFQEQPGTYYPLDVIREACARHASAEGLSQDEAARISALRVGLDELHAREIATEQSSAEQKAGARNGANTSGS